MSRYAELAAASNFSFLRAASHPEELVQTAAALGLEALGVVDRNSVSGVVRAWAAGRKAGGGLKVLAGARLAFSDGTPDLVCYPSDRAAWGRLTRLLTLGKRWARKGECDLTLGDFLDHAEGLLTIVLPPAPGKAGGRTSPGGFTLWRRPGGARPGWAACAATAPATCRNWPGWRPWGRRPARPWSRWARCSTTTPAGGPCRTS